MNICLSSNAKTSKKSGWTSSRATCGIMPTLSRPSVSPTMRAARECAWPWSLAKRQRISSSSYNARARALLFQTLRNTSITARVNRRPLDLHIAWQIFTVQPRGRKISCRKVHRRPRRLLQRKANKGQKWLGAVQLVLLAKRCRDQEKVLLVANSLLVNLPLNPMVATTLLPQRVRALCLCSLSVPHPAQWACPV